MTIKDLFLCLSVSAFLAFVLIYGICAEVDRLERVAIEEVGRG